LGVQFRHQVVLGRYVADFLAAEVGLVVEVDGGYHERSGCVRARMSAASVGFESTATRCCG
jgi:very-short-patch-repair endonuclease